MSLQIRNFRQIGDYIFNVFNRRLAAVEDIAGEMRAEVSEEIPVMIAPLGSRVQEVGIEISDVLSRPGRVSDSRALARFNQAEGLIRFHFHDSRRCGIIAQQEQPVQGRAFHMFGGAFNPVRIEKGMGLFRRFEAEWRASVQTAVIDTQTFGIQAVLFADNYVFTLAVIEKRGQMGKGFHAIGRQEEFPLGDAGNRSAS